MSRTLLTTTSSGTSPFTIQAENICLHGMSPWGPIFRTVSIPEIDKVIFQKDHTIVLWKDRTKTIVKCSEENFDEEKGLAMAIAKKYMKRNEFKKAIANATHQEIKK